MTESNSFDLLSSGVQRWIYKQGWQDLRAVQEKAVPAILQAKEDILITAPTAGGKTEAAFLPIVTWLEGTNIENSYGVLCLSPLKALINDQYQRLLPLCESSGTEITPWHGDVSSSVKKNSWKTPSGILIITPESLEAMFVTRPHELKIRISSLKYIVIDEFHSFLNRERGQQLISLLSRLEDMIERPLCRIALSATIGSPSIALKCLRPDNSRPGVHLDITNDSLKLQLALKTYLMGKKADLPVSIDMAVDLFQWLRGSSHLVFANSRRLVEEFTDLLAKSCEYAGVPVEFFAHHGSLSRDARHFLEQRLKEGNKPTTAIATSTLELGIDIGDVTSVVQIGAPANVSSLRQRLGRSGRRGDSSSILRLLITGHSQKKEPCPIDLLEIEIFQTIAVIELMFERWIEPPDEHALHLSTLVQQILSMISFKGGVTALKAYQVLCLNGPWKHIPPDLFARVLKALGANQVITQLSDGELIVDIVGERLISHYTFYTAFEVPEEYRLIANGKTLGTLPVTTPYVEGQLLLFSGRRWSIESIDAKSQVMTLARSQRGQAPTFGGEVAPVHRKIRQYMSRLYQNAQLPKYCDQQTSSLMVDARAFFLNNDIINKPLVIDRGVGYWFIWESDRVLDTIKVCVNLAGFPSDRLGSCVTLDILDTGNVDDFFSIIKEFMNTCSVDDICELIEAQPLGKFDMYLGPKLVKESFVVENLDFDGAIEYINSLDTNTVLHTTTKS